MTITIIRKTMLALASAALFAPAIAQSESKEMKLKTFESEVLVEVSKEKAWKVLSSYVDAGGFHGSLISSHCETPGKETGVGATRFCQIDKKISVSETIVDWKEGEYYTYEVVDWKNFPLKKMYQTFGVKTGSNGETVLYNKVQYRLSNFFIEWMASGRLKKGTREVLVYYKDYMETGTVKRPREELKKLYPEELKRG